MCLSVTYVFVYLIIIYLNINDRCVWCDKPATFSNGDMGNCYYADGKM